MERTTILLIEDERLFSKAVEQTLKYKARFQFNLLHANSLAEGLETLGEHAIDVILLDLSLPDSSSLASLRQIRRHYPMLPVIILTGNDDEDLAISALQEGAQDYLLKGELDGRTLGRSITYSIERSHLMQQRDDFMATLVHDLKNPLSGSDRVFQLILEQKFGELDPRLREVTSILKSTNESAMQLLANLLEIYRYDVSKPIFSADRIDLQEVISLVVEELSPLAQVKNLECTTRLMEPILVSADANALRRVFMNLIGNSIKFTPNHGKIQIEAYARADQARVVIRDTGSGISEQEQRFLFQRFYQSSTGRNHAALGTGLGLYLCRQVVEAHNGQIRCESRPREETTFFIDFPLVSSDENYVLQ